MIEDQRSLLQLVREKVQALVNWQSEKANLEQKYVPSYRRDDTRFLIEATYTELAGAERLIDWAWPIVMPTYRPIPSLELQGEASVSEFLCRREFRGRECHELWRRIVNILREILHAAEAAESRVHNSIDEMPLSISNELAPPTAHTPTQTGARDDVQSNPPDGPFGASRFRWKGKEITLPPKPWGVVEALWDAKDHTMNDLDIARKVWRDEEKAGRATTAAISSANNAFLSAGIPISVHRGGEKIWIKLPCAESTERVPD